MPHFAESGELISEDGSWRWTGDHRQWERIAPTTKKPGMVTRLFVKEEAWGKPGFEETHKAASMFANRKELLLTERANKVLTDDILTKDEEQQLLEFAESLGVDDLNQYPAILHRLVIANANAGRFPKAAPPLHVICKPGEVVYVESQASLLKEVADRQWQGGSSGFSFRIAKGVRYRTGSTRGHMQEVGTKIIEKDTGALSVTSSRLVFSGRTTTQESPFSKIENLTVFNDGLAVAVRRGSDIVTRLYSTTDAEMIAAIINGAMQPHAATDAPQTAEQGPPVANFGLISPDGKWRWDGTAWQPIEQPPPPPT
ncbi:MAG: hypothetical protein DMF54_17040 [Acidobacteria bacterium]|nr:MAG: hypothetical protein DMF54_17040 [Acidobacteriota bacterium]